MGFPMCIIDYGDFELIFYPLSNLQRVQYFTFKGVCRSSILIIVNFTCASYMQGERNYNRFGAWLGKNSTFGKNMRLLEDLHVHILASRESCSGR